MIEYRDGREIVACDNDCGAFEEPETLDEYKATFGALPVPPLAERLLSRLLTSAPFRFHDDRRPYAFHHDNHVTYPLHHAGRNLPASSTHGPSP